MVLIIIVIARRDVRQDGFGTEGWSVPVRRHVALRGEDQVSAKVQNSSVLAATSRTLLTHLYYKRCLESQGRPSSVSEQTLKPLDKKVKMENASDCMSK